MEANTENAQEVLKEFDDLLIDYTKGEMFIIYEEETTNFEEDCEELFGEARSRRRRIKNLLGIHIESEYDDKVVQRLQDITSCNSAGNYVLRIP